MIDARLHEIAERVEKATPGPWRIADSFCHGNFFPIEAGDPEQPDLTGGDRVFPGGRPEDETFLVAAREDVPWLLDEVRRLKEQLAEAEREAWDQAWESWGEDN